MKRTIAILSLAALALAACGGSDTPGADMGAGSSETAAQVQISAFQYRPDPVEIQVGDTVVWTNDDNIDHTVTSGTQREQGVPGVEEGGDARPDGVFDGTLATKGDTFEFTFEEPGRYDYFCAIHAGMTGTVEVSG